MSRSIGDGRFKRLGVIAQPDILRCELTAEDPFVVIGCDGLWSQFSADGAAKYVHDALLSMPTLVSNVYSHAALGQLPASNTLHPPVWITMIDVDTPLATPPILSLPSHHPLP